ncbi:protein kinase [Aureispira sp. CCB-QB1]|uniref:protein kinase domain-containing protein n=1 Tax=Aureispira sp. CCB-QB1 TaxID=1313421 RepID=UPI00069610FE|nr:protein kinase [Aureispira sp. CCB-QB1]
MEKNNFYELDNTKKEELLQGFFGRGKCTFHTSGMCGEIFLFDKAENLYPRYTCIKVPKPMKDVPNKEITKRFIKELELQLSFCDNKFVHSPFDFDVVSNIPIASFRYWGNDLAKLIRSQKASQVTKYSLLIYISIGLKHCYKKGMIAHQDLKPANIFIRNVKKEFVGLPDLDIYDFALVADFGLANASIDSHFGGARPYMAPEQWRETNLSQSTDVFALGVIFYELITNGFHPVGIALRDFWPVPKNGNTLKWTKPKLWKKWINNDCKIKLPNNVSIDVDILNFIKRMLSINPQNRPSIDDVIQFLFDQIDNISPESNSRLKFIIDHFENQSSPMTNLKTEWSYLFSKWENLKNHFK